MSVIQEVFRLSVRGSFLEAARETSHADTPLSQPVVMFYFDRCPFLTEESLRLSTIPEFLKEWGKVKQEGGLVEVGVRRLQAAVEQFLSRSDVRLVQALFRLTDGMNVWVLARIHIPRTEDGEEILEGGIVVGGLSSLVVETEPRDSEE
jgi:hypothetical protein